MSFRDTKDLSETRMVNKPEREAKRIIPEKGIFKEIEFGAGSKTFKGDERGIWMGSDDFETAPFSVDMEGNINVRASALTENVAFRFYDENGNLSIFIGFEEALNE